MGKNNRMKKQILSNVKVDALLIENNIFVRAKEKSWLEFRIKIETIQFLSTFRKLYNYYIYENLWKTLMNKIKFRKNHDMKIW